MATTNARSSDYDKKDGNIEFLLKQFRREVEKEGILSESKKRRYFVKNSRIKHEKNKKQKHKRKLDAKRSSPNYKHKARNR